MTRLAAACSQLRELCKDNERITALQAAVDRQAGIRAFVAIDSPDAPVRTGALASFNKDIVLKHADSIPGLQRMVKEVNVDSIL